jgi:hypothetical protein
VKLNFAGNCLFGLKLLMVLPLSQLISWDKACEHGYPLFLLKLVINIVQNVTDQWSSHLLATREVPGSNICPKNGYADLSFLWLNSVPPGK